MEQSATPEDEVPTVPAESDNCSNDPAVDDTSAGAVYSAGTVQPSRSENLAMAELYVRRALGCEQEVFSTPAQAKAAAQLVERVRRMVFGLSVATLHDMAESRICDQHGHTSAKVMYSAVNKQSGRDLYGLEQVRKMFDRCARIFKAARKGRLSEDHLRLMARVYANRRVRKAFVSQQSWFLKKARRFNFKEFEILVDRWVQVHDDDGSDPNAAHQNRCANIVHDVFSDSFTVSSTQGPLAGAAMQQIFGAYVQAEFAKDWEASHAIHGDQTSVDRLSRTHQQRSADALAQIFTDAAANANSAMPVNYVHNIVWSASTFEEMARRHAGYRPQPFDLDDYRCETIDGVPLEPNETFLDALMSPLRRIVLDAIGVVIDKSEQRFFTGLARTALQIAYPGCVWPGCNVPASRCQADHMQAKCRGGPTTQENGTLFCGRHNRHKERGYAVWRDPTTGQIRISSPAGEEITEPWSQRAS